MSFWRSYLTTERLSRAGLGLNLEIAARAETDILAEIDRENSMAVLGPSTTMDQLEGDVKKMAYEGLVPETREIDAKTLQVGDVVFFPRAGACGRVARVMHSYGTYFLLDDGDGHVRATDVVLQRRPLRDGDVLDHVSDPYLRWQVEARNESRFLLWNERKQWTHANGLPIDWYWDSTPTTDLINPRLGDIFIYERESGVEEIEVVGLFYTGAVGDGDHFRDVSGGTWRAKQLRLARRRPLSGETLCDHDSTFVYSDGMATAPRRAEFVMANPADVPTIFAVPSSFAALPNAAHVPLSPPMKEMTDLARHVAFLAQSSFFGKSGHALARIGEPRFEAADADRKSITIAHVPSARVNANTIVRDTAPIDWTNDVLDKIAKTIAERYVSMSESALALHLYQTDPDVYAEAMLRGEVPTCPLHGDAHPATLHRMKQEMSITVVKTKQRLDPFFENAVYDWMDLEAEREKTVSQQRSEVANHLVCNCPNRLSRFLNAVDVAWKSEIGNSKGRRYDAELRAEQICGLVAPTVVRK